MTVVPTEFAVGLDGSAREKRLRVIAGFLAGATGSMDFPAVYGDGGSRFRGSRMGNSILEILYLLDLQIY